jgi:hypothetical protein
MPLVGAPDGAVETDVGMISPQIATPASAGAEK